MVDLAKAVRMLLYVKPLKIQVMSRTIRFKEEDSSMKKVNKAFKRAAHKAARRVAFRSVEYNSTLAANLYAEALQRREEAEKLFEEAKRLLRESESLRRKADLQPKEVQVVCAEAHAKDKEDFEGMPSSSTCHGRIPKWETSDYKLMEKLGFFK
jgi:hypothetical protein